MTDLRMLIARIGLEKVRPPSGTRKFTLEDRHADMKNETMKDLSNSRKRRDHGTDVAADKPRKNAPPAMGELEAATYRAACKEVNAFRAFVEAIPADRKARPKTDIRKGFAALRSIASRDDEDDNRAGKPGIDSAEVLRVAELAARLMFARLFDQRPALLDDLRRRAPTIVIDIPSPDLFTAVADSWKTVLFDPKLLRKVAADGSRRRHRDDDALYLVARDPQKPAKLADQEHMGLVALSMGLPLIAISPSGNSHLPQCILRAATARIEMAPLDPTTIGRAIRIVTGRRSPRRLDALTAAGTSLSDLAIAVRFDREPEECLAELERLAAVKHATKDARDLTLAQLHGLGEAREWAEMAIADIKAWRAGEIGWNSVASAVALTGLPGTGKTTFAKVFAAEAGMNLITATLAKWQASGEAHLGHLLRAMRQDFQDARARSPCVLFIDEIDSFPDRASLTHSHKDYQIEVVNSLLELVDGIAGRDGVVLIGASNDLSRCDPALLRSGRFERIVDIGLPGQDDREKMLRVRLGRDLPDIDLEPLAELAIGMTGADIERVVNDARRFARRASRPMIEDDLRKAVAVEDTRPFELRWRACVHEAGHNRRSPSRRVIPHRIGVVVTHASACIDDWTFRTHRGSAAHSPRRDRMEFQHGRYRYFSKAYRRAKRAVGGHRTRAMDALAEVHARQGYAIGEWITRYPGRFGRSMGATMRHVVRRPQRRREAE
ncbi:ATP-binding protein [Tardiphaga sp. 866_E4_N2_1]|uniref:ATP-binding protein n=1 Tax=unclassified Tardiphaga TaxID=2631404 RepID=UPI003F273FA0